MLKDTGGAMPWPTRLLIFLSDAIRHPAFYLGFILLGGLFVGGLRQILTRPELRRRWTHRIHRLPLLGTTLRLISLTRFAQNFYVTHRVGLPVIQCLEFSSQATNDPCLIHDLEGVIESVKEGSMIGQALLESGSFPSTFCQAISAGEESGSLDDMLQSMARMYQVDLEHNLELMTKSLEPIMLGIVGSIVAFTVVATLLPMLKVIESL